MKKNKIENLNELELFDVFNFIQRYFFLFFLVCIVSLSVSFILNSKLEKRFISKIVLMSPSENDIFTMKVLNNSNTQFTNEFVNMMKSRDNIDNYLKKKNLSNLIDKISLTAELNQDEELKKKPIGLKYYNNNLVFFIEYPEHIDGEFILSDFTKETQSLAIKSFVNKRQKFIEKLIKDHNRALDIAFRIKQTEPLLKSLVEGNSVISEPTALFYKGTKVLAQQILHLEEDLNYLSNSKFDFKVVLDRPSGKILVNNQLYKNLFKGLLFGIFLTLLIISIFRIRKKFI